MVNIDGAVFIKLYKNDVYWLAEYFKKSTGNMFSHVCVSPYMWPHVSEIIVTTIKEILQDMTSDMLTCCEIQRKHRLCFSYRSSFNTQFSALSLSECRSL